VVGDDFDLELQNEHAQSILGQAGLCSEWFVIRTANVAPPLLSNPFPVMVHTPSVTHAEDNELVLDHHTARGYFHRDFGARFVLQSRENINPKQYRTRIWRLLCDINGMQFDDLDCVPAKVHYLDRTRGAIISPLVTSDPFNTEGWLTILQLLNTIPERVCQNWSQNQFTSTIFPAHGL
jgi:hypothetical protein